MKRSDAIKLIESLLYGDISVGSVKHSVANRILEALEESGMLPPTIRAKFNVGSKDRTVCERYVDLNRWEKEGDKEEKEER